MVSGEPLAKPPEPKPKKNMKSVLLLLSLRALIARSACLLTLLVVPVASAAYSFKNVQIQGGGFVPGIIFNQTQPNLI